MRLQSRLLAVFVLLCVWIPAIAERVSGAQSAAAARAFFSPSATKSAAMAVRISEAGVTKGDSPAYRVYNRDGGGFVVIAGDDAVEPVLAYSFEGTFPSEDDMPDNMT